PVLPAPPGGGFYLLRSAGQIWLNYWLGLLLDTTGRPNGLNTISVKLFAAQDTTTEIGSAADPRRAAKGMIDNPVPGVGILALLHEPGNVLVNTCAIVNTGAPTFAFRVTASAPLSHLLGWSLIAYWGDNKSKVVASDSYSNHVSPSKLWAGITS